MNYLIPEDVAKKNGINEERFVKFLEVHITQARLTDCVPSEDTLRFRIEKNFGNVDEDVYNVIVQELKLILEDQT